MADLIDVTVCDGACPCPGKPHAAETVSIVPELDMGLASGALSVVQRYFGTGEEAAVQTALVRAYLPAVIRRWSFIEPDGTGGLRPVPVTRANMDRLIPWSNGGLDLADKCDELYSGALLAPLVDRMSKSSQPGPTDDSTSPNLPSGSALPEPSGLSSEIDTPAPIPTA